VEGVASPLNVKPAPLTEIWAIVREADPVFVTLKVCDFICPSTTLPKSNEAGETLSPACTPVAVRGIESGDPFASLVTMTAPEAFATVVGAKPTVKVTLSDAFTVEGTGTPVTLKPLPTVLIWEIFTAAFPVFVRTICFEALPPVLTFPKLMLVGLAVHCPTGEFVPLPVREMVTVGFVGSLLVIAKLPFPDPTAVGRNVNVNVAVCPVLMVLGVVIPLTANPVPVNVSSEMVRSEPPAFEMIKFSVLCVPTPTLPKSTVELVGEICG
jgi:hypothetical protein